jgi:adenylate cyclase
MGYIVDKEAAVSEAYQLAKRAIDLDERNEYAHWGLGFIQLWRRNHDLAAAELKRAIEINPNCSLAFGSLGTVLSYSGEPEESIKNNEIAIRLNPRDISIFFRYSGVAMAHFVAGRYSDAVQWARKCIHRKPIYRRCFPLILTCDIQPVHQSPLTHLCPATLTNYRIPRPRY